jgi:predicted glycoside hydrolase/deacetylase ChbG (UPF0249 family)
MIIINADDFGKDCLTNRAVIQTFREGLCSSISVMANMPGFEEASQLSCDFNLLNHVGLHIVLDDGCPLTEEIKKYSLFYDGKRLCYARNKRSLLYLSLAEKKVLAQEVRAQIERSRQRGIAITHLDSHHHIHTEWPLASILIPIAQEERIPYIRISRNCGPGLAFYKKGYKFLFNGRLKNAGLAKTEYFGSIQDYIYLKRHKALSSVTVSFEVMIHPGFDHAQRLIDLEGPQDQELAAALREVQCN